MKDQEVGHYIASFSDIMSIEFDISMNDNISQPCILNGLLTYVNTVINNSSIDNILKIVVNFYNSNDILLAKKLMWQTCDNDIIGSLMSRHNSRQEQDPKQMLMLQI